MTAVQRIKQKHDLDILLRAIAPAARRNQEKRREEESRKARVNANLSRRGSRLRLL